MFWNLYAWVYDTVRLLVPYQEMIDRVTSLVVLSCKNKLASVLDAGCGSGNLLLAVKKSYVGYPCPELTGVDASERMLHKAHQKVGSATLRNVDLTLPLDFADETFNAVTSINVLYALPKDRQLECFNELLRVTKPGGVVCVVVPKQGANPKTVLRSHLARRGLIHTAWILPRLILLGILFKKIEKGAQNGTYTYFAEEDLDQFEFDVVLSVYADQNWLGVRYK